MDLPLLAVLQIAGLPSDHCNIQLELLMTVGDPFKAVLPVYSSTRVLEMTSGMYHIYRWHMVMPDVTIVCHCAPEYSQSSGYFPAHNTYIECPS